MASGQGTRGDEREERRPHPVGADDDGLGGDVPVHPRGHKGAYQTAGAHETEQHADQRRRGAARLCEDDEHEHHGLEDEVAAGHQQRRDTEERLAPEPDQPFRDLLVKRCRGPRPLLLEVAAHKQQRDHGDEVGNGIGGERYGGAEAEEDAAERIAGEGRPPRTGFVLREGGRQLLGRYDVRQGSAFGQHEHHEQRALREGDDRDLRERENAGGVGDRDAPQGEAAQRVADDHGALAVPAIDQVARRQLEEEEGQGAREPDETGFRW